MGQSPWQRDLRRPAGKKQPREWLKNGNYNKAGLSDRTSLRYRWLQLSLVPAREFGDSAGAGLAGVLLCGCAERGWSVFSFHEVLQGGSFLSAFE